MTKVFENIPGVNWIQNAGDFISVDPKKCTGCGDCIKVCLGSCFEIQKKQARIRSLDTCMECGACWYVCSEDAILFSWPKGGTGFRTEWG